MNLNKKMKQLVPTIRFNHFSDQWTRQKLTDVTVNLDKLRVPIAKDQRIPGAIPYYGANGIQDYVNGFTHDGKLVLVAEDGANNLIDYPIKIVNGKAWVNNHVHILAAQEHVSHYLFIGKSLKTVNFKPYLSGAGRTKLNNGELKKINIYLPSLPEQIRIGTLFHKLDHLIAVKKRKLAVLYDLQRALLQQLFPQRNAVNPQLRFTYFSTDYQQY